MATDFEGGMRFPAQPDVVFAMMSDPSYVLWKHKRMAAFDISVDVTNDDGLVTIRSSRKLPAKIPAAAKSLVGESIHIDEVHKWGAAAPDGTRDAQISATFGTSPMSVSGTMHLEPSGEGSIVKFRIAARAAVPLIGGKLETIAGEHFLKAVKKEQAIAPEWLAEHGEQS